MASRPYTPRPVPTLEPLAFDDLCFAPEPEVVEFWDVADNVRSDTTGNSRFASTFRCYLDNTWSRLDFIETIEFIRPDVARITYLDICEGNARRVAEFGF